MLLAKRLRRLGGEQVEQRQIQNMLTKRHRVRGWEKLGNGRYTTWRKVLADAQSLSVVA